MKITELNYAHRIVNAKKSAIRELLKLTANKEVISFAGGLPAATSFPVEDLAEIAQNVMTKNPIKALQYGTTEGNPDFRQVLADRYNDYEGLNVKADNFLITTASQQGLDFLGRVFIDEGDSVIVELPSYLGALNAFSVYGADLVGVGADENGMDPKILVEKIESLIAENRKPKFIYLVPDFQNPSGLTMPVSRRKEILEISYKYQIIIIEDSPYREIRFDGEAQDMFYKLDNSEGNVITLGSLSKILAPGFRVGWMISRVDILDKFITTKQTADLCTSSYLQMIATEYMASPKFQENLNKIVVDYGKKRDFMLSCFEKYMPEGTTWTKPEGGLFLFLTFPEHIDSQELFKIAIANNVAFVVGHVFYCDGSGKNTARLNFSYATLEQICEGVKRLATAIKEYKV